MGTFARIQPLLPPSSPTFAISSSVCVVQLQDGKTKLNVQLLRPFTTVYKMMVQTLYAGAGQSTLPLPSKTLPERRSLDCYQPLTCSAWRTSALLSEFGTARRISGTVRTKNSSVVLERIGENLILAGESFCSTCNM